MTTFKLYEPENTSVMLFSSFKTDTIVAQDLLFTYTNLHKLTQFTNSHPLPGLKTMLTLIPEEIVL